MNPTNQRSRSPLNVEKLEDRLVLAAPAATLTSAPNVNAASVLDDYLFTITFADDTGIKAETARYPKIVVARNGAAFPGTGYYISSTPDANSASIAALFRFTPPGDFWDQADNGVYTVSLASDVLDLDGNAAPQGPLGSFTVTTAQTDGFPELLFIAPKIDATSPKNEYFFEVEMKDADGLDLASFRSNNFVVRVRGTTQYLGTTLISATASDGGRTVPARYRLDPPRRAGRKRTKASRWWNCCRGSLRPTHWAEPNAAQRSSACSRSTSTPCRRNRRSRPAASCSNCSRTCSAGRWKIGVRGLFRTFGERRVPRQHRAGSLVLGREPRAGRVDLQRQGRRWRPAVRAVRGRESPAQLTAELHGRNYPRTTAVRTPC